MVEPQFEIDPVNPAPGLSHINGTFVGRQREMAAMKAKSENALSGHGRLVMLLVAEAPAAASVRLAALVLIRILLTWLGPSRIL